MSTKAQKRKDKLQALVLSGATDKDLEIFDSINELEDRLDQTVAEIHDELDKKVAELKRNLPNLQDVLEQVKGKPGEPGETPSDDKLISLITPLIPPPVIPKDGEDYVLTPDDKKEIASLVKVPVVKTEKVVEKVEVIKEQPIVTEKVVQVALSDTPEVMAEKLNTLSEKLDPKVIKGLLGIIENVRSSAAVPPTTTFFFQNGVQKGRAKNINIVNGSVSVAGDTATIVLTGGGSGVTVETPPEEPDGSITNFTVSAQPQWVDTEAGHYYEGYGYSYSSGSITLDLAPNKSENGGYVRVII